MELIQTHTSKNTSINKEKFPRIYTHINWNYLKGMRVLDYGCGRYTEHIRKLMWLYDIEWYGYDPDGYMTKEEWIEDLGKNYGNNVELVIDKCLFWQDSANEDICTIHGWDRACTKIRGLLEIL